MKIQLFINIKKNIKKDYLKTGHFLWYHYSRCIYSHFHGICTDCRASSGLWLYGSILPILLFAIFSTSKQFIFGVDAAPAALAGSALLSLGIVPGSEAALNYIPIFGTFLLVCGFFFFLH